MGQLGTKVPFEEFKSKVLPWLNRFCKDFNWQIWKAAAINLQTMFQILLDNNALSEEYEDLFDLIDDEE